MGWCSATKIFDVAVEGWLNYLNEKTIKFDLLNGEDYLYTVKILDDLKLEIKTKIKSLIGQLEENDWDCWSDSSFYEHPLIREIYMELYPNWFKDDV